MRRSIQLCALLALGLPLATQAQSGTRLASPKQLNERSTYSPVSNQIYFEQASGTPAAAQISPVGNIPAGIAKTTAVNPVMLGRASNSLTILRPSQNQVTVDNATNTVGFIHRQDVTIFGGGGTSNGIYRYDLSIDGGSTFTNEIGPIQQLNTNYGRYPNATLYNNGDTSPFDLDMIYLGPTNRFPAPGWIGHIYGVAEVTNGTLTYVTEHYFSNGTSLLPGGLTKGLTDEFWAAEFAFDGNATMDSVRILKGIYNQQTRDIDFSNSITIDPGFDRSFDGDIHAAGPNIAFSPDGMTGYVAMLSDIVGGVNNNTYMPVVIKTTDGGATWGSPIEVDLDAIPWIADSLQTLWIDSSGAPASSGEATTGFDMDVVVDDLGNPHIAVVIGTHAQGYSISSGLAKFMADVYSPDGGLTWNATYLSPVLTFRGTYGTGSSPITVDNYVQASRTDDGRYLFFSWADSDTSQFTGSMAGIGFGESGNLAPNLRVTAKRVLDNAITYPKLVTDGDLLWDGRAITPTMSPNMLVQNGMAYAPIVVMDLISSDPNQPVQFWYFGNDAVFDLNGPIWCDENVINLSWPNISNPGGPLPCVIDALEAGQMDDVVLYDWFPNPSNGTSRIGIELPATMNVQMTLTNMYGQVVGTIAEGELAAGKHSFDVPTSSLAGGIYFCNLIAEGKQLSKKLMVAH